MEPILQIPFKSEVSDSAINDVLSTLQEIPKKIVLDFEIHFFDCFKENQICRESDLRKLNCYEILWVKKGAGLLTINLMDYSITDNQIYLFRPGMLRQVHSTCRIDGYYLSLSNDFYNVTGVDFQVSLSTSNHKDFNSPIIVQMDDVIQCEMEEILIKMQKEFVNYYTLRFEILKGLSKIFLLYLSREFVAKNGIILNSRDSQLINRFKALLNRHFIKEKTVAYYASELCITSSHLNQVVKKVLGLTASHYIQQYTVLEAKRHAMHSELSMKEVAHALGFNDTSHFSKFFKKAAGMNFSHFKKELS